MQPPHDDAGAARATVSVQPARKWVWHSTLASRAAGQVSVLACVETVFAVALYWWIAIRFQTHLHLISSVFVAPLLLLRSPESIAAGVRWFRTDWFGMAGYEGWSRRKKVCWVGAVVVVSSLVTYFLTQRLIQRWLPGLNGWPLFGWAAAIGAFSVVVTGATASASVGTGVIPGAGGFTSLGAGVLAVAAAFASVLVAVVTASVTSTWAAIGTGTVANTDMGLGVGSGGAAALLSAIGAGMALRSLFFRVVATLRFLPAGLERLPENWRENNFLTDLFLPAELMPGIRDSKPLFAMDGFKKEFAEDRDWARWVSYPLLGIIFFLPAFLYRLNIKATTWFWWPLAYLLRPAPTTGTPGEEKQALCWPWTNLFQRSLILVSVLLVVGSLVAHGIDPTYWEVLKKLPALQFVFKVAFAIDWAHFAPWHIVQWIIAGSGIGMLWVAGDALSHDRNGNWSTYRQKLPSKIRLMVAFERVRYLGVVALLLMAIGALLLLDRGWQKYVPVPEQWVAAMERFYVVKE